MTIDRGVSRNWIRASILEEKGVIKKQKEPALNAGGFSQESLRARLGMKDKIPVERKCLSCSTYFQSEIDRVCRRCKDRKTALERDI